ncbi:MAG: baseplate J/gp47 family protein [Pseudomonadota bacterium]
MRTEIADWSALHVSDGQAQENRPLPALSPDWIRPQERTLADWISLVATLSRHVRFGGREAGGRSWRRLFDSDPLTMMAEILAFRPDEALTEFLTVLDRTPLDAAEHIARLSDEVDRWVNALHRADIAAVDTQIHQLGAAEAEATLGIRIAPGRARALSAVGVSTTEADTPVGAARAARDKLVADFEDLLSVIAQLRPTVEVAFSERVSSGTLDPTLGLLVAQMQVMERVAEDANRFTARHTKFYLSDIIGQEPIPARHPDILLHVAPAPTPVDLPAGTSLALRTADGPVLGSFVTRRDVRIAPIEVLDARTIRFERDHDISPQAGLGFVTGIRASETPLEAVARARPLFAADTRAPFRMGLRISHPIFALSEGTRRIEVQIDMSRKEGVVSPVATPVLRGEAKGAGDPRAAELSRILSADPGLSAVFSFSDQNAVLEEIMGWIDALPLDNARDPLIDQTYHACLRNLRTEEQLREVCGRIVTRTLVEGTPWPALDYADALRKRLDSDLMADEVSTKIKERILGWNRLDVFQNLLGDAFELTLTGDKGATVRPICRVAPNRSGPGLTFTLDVDPSDPALTPPEGGTAPELIIRIAPRGGFCPLSVFEAFRIDRIRLGARVHGLTALKGFTDEGPVNVGQPFPPFGVRPRDGASFLVGAPELSGKTICDVALNITWGDLPEKPGGFATYYAPYGNDAPVPDPKVQLDYRAADGWKPLSHAPVPMIAENPRDGVLLPEARFAASVPGQGAAAEGGDAVEEFRQRRTIRAGAVRVTLSGSEGGFAHALYPAALAESIRPRLLRLRARPIPPQPFVPQITDVSLDYTARADILLDDPDSAVKGERVDQLSPFGTQELYPARTRRDVGLFPERLADGILMLNLPARATEGPISLLFDLAEGSHERLSFAPEPITWYRLTSRGWQAFPNWAIAADSTDGLMRSGIVSLEVPRDAVEGSSEVPGPGIWIAATASGRLNDFPSLVRLSTNGIRLSVAPEGTADLGAAAGRTWTFAPAVPGLGAVTEQTSLQGGLKAESRRAFNTRVSERLRHRQRAVTAWDVERLVLEAFPDVWKVKCFPVLDRRTEEPRAGHVTVVVVPHPPANALEVPEQPAMFDVLTMRRIEGMLRDRMDPFAELEVRNPGFERIQIRARLRFARNRDDGAIIRRIKTELSRSLSVWTAQAPMNGFGWSINLNDIRAALLSREDVERVSGLSALHLTRSDGAYHALGDSAPGRRQPEEPRIAGREPWSLPLPMAHHMLDPLGDDPPRRAERTGISGLAVGGTLVVDKADTE